MNSDVDRYLRKATRGLWGKKKREVEEELGAHIQGRVNAHRMAGSSEKVAVRKTIRELGQPEKVSSGMTRLYTLPTALSLGTLMLGLCVSLVLIVSQTSAQTLNSSFSWPSPVCLEGKEKETCISDEPWFDLAALRTVLEPQGVTIEETRWGLSLLFPHSSIPVIVPVGIPSKLIEEDGKPYPSDYQATSGFYRLSPFLAEVAQDLTVPMQVSGWEQLTVKIADVVFEVDMRGSGSQRWSFDRDPGYYFYNDYLFKIVRAVTLPKTQEGTIRLAIRYPNARDKDSLQKRFRLATFKEGVYGVISRTASTPDMGDSNYSFALDVTRSNANGTFKLRLPKTHEGFVNDLKGMSVGDSLLVRLTGELRAEEFGYEVVPPEQIKLE